MHKTLFFTILYLTVFSVSQAQDKKAKHDTTAYYMRNDYEMAYNEADAKSLRLIIKEKGGLYRIEDYYLDAKPKMIAKSTVNNLNFEPGTQGERIDYYPSGNVMSITQYEKGQLIGDLKRHYYNGNLYTITTLKNRSEYLKQCLDSAGNILADQGNGKWVDFDATFSNKREGPVVNGKREGEWVQTKNNGDKITGIYKDGILVSGDLFRQDTITYSKVDISPSFPGGDFKLFNFLAKNIKYPSRARDANVQGRVVVTFVIEKTGELTNIRVVRGIGSGCDEEAIRVLKLSPNWLPGYANGRPARVQYSLPISFTLGEGYAPRSSSM